jgi:hypothetical protein
MTMDCHHCGNFGHKKYECTSKCRVGCKWCDKPPSRRQPSHRSSIEIQRQHSNVNIQRSQGSTSKYIFIFLFFLQIKTNNS